MSQPTLSKNCLSRLRFTFNAGSLLEDLELAAVVGCDFIQRDSLLYCMVEYVEVF